MALFAAAISGLPVWNGKAAQQDWLVEPVRLKAAVYQGAKPNELVLANGLIARRFRISPNAATVALDDLVQGTSLLRAVKPEGSVTVDGKTYAIGGLVGQPNLAFLTEAWIDAMRANPDAFRYVGYQVGKPRKHLEWKHTRQAGNQEWPPKGVALDLEFEHPATKLRALVHYELYDGVPAFLKWLEIKNESGKAVQIDAFKSEMLALAETQSLVDRTDSWERPAVGYLTDYAFGGMSLTNSMKGVRIVADPEYKTQVNYDLTTPCLLEATPPIGPAQALLPGETFKSHRTYILAFDSTERERRTLSLRRLYRTIAPWATENPIMLHLTSTDPATVHRAIDQAGECGFEIVVISFWSGLDMEDGSPANLAKFREFREYANSKGIQLGGYSLLASRRIDDKNDVINPKTGKTGGAIFENSPCLESEWGQAYFEKIRKFIKETGFQVFEHDGNYPGDLCASTTHPGHKGLEDSQWNQWRRITALYADLLAQGVTMNVPDHYFLAGSTKTGMGYRESNWSLPREQQHIHARQNLFDGTWDKTPSMGWMMVPLVEYQGGGPAATIEPLKDHLPDYEMHLANNFGYGAQACYRGPRLYDSPETKAAVQKWVSWFKQHRSILESDIVHLRRPDGQNPDAILHVNPSLETKGMALVWNPSTLEATVTLELPLHYTGIRGTAKLRVANGRWKSAKLDAQHRIKEVLKIPSQGLTWVELRQG